MAEQLQQLGKLTAEAAANLKRCETCANCTAKGYCSPLLYRSELPDCDARWNEWGRIIIESDCPAKQFTNQKPITPKPTEKIMDKEILTATVEEAEEVVVPSEPGLYWAAIRFASQPQTPTLAAIKTTAATRATKLGGYNAIVALGGQRPPVMRMRALAVPVVSAVTMTLSQWRDLDLTAVEAFGPKVVIPRME
jgi:hypothetical protein